MFKTFIIIVIIIIIIVITYCSFSHELLLMGFPGNLSGRKSLDVFGSLLSTLAVLNNAVVLMVPM